VRFIYQYPETHGATADMLDPGPPAELAVAAEAAGWHGFAFTEHPAPGARWLDAGGHQSLDPLVALGHIAAVTTRLKLMTNLAVGPYRNPLSLAKSVATVDKLSHGRMILGVGTGYLKGEFRALGVDFEERNALFDEMLDTLPSHWSGKPFSYAGTHFVAKDTIGLPRPVQDPIPIWIGGNSKLTLRRVAERGHGWLPMLAGTDISTTTRTPHIGSIDELGAKIAELRELAGDRAATLDVTASLFDSDTSRHAETIARLQEIGVTWIIAGGGRNDARAFIDEFAARCIS
jgi:probable F420-dependent oxidoreductase